VTGRSAVAYYRTRDALVRQAAEALGAPNDDLMHAIARLLDRVGELEAEVKGFRSETAKDVVQALAQQAVIHQGVSVVAGAVDARDMPHLLSLTDQVRDRVAPAVVILAADIEGKGALIVSVTPGVAGVDAGAIAKASAHDFGGGGGGSPQLGRREGRPGPPGRGPGSCPNRRLEGSWGVVRVLGIDLGRSRTA